MMGKCPFCGKFVSKLNGNGVEVSFGIGGSSFNAVTYACGSCNAVLSCQIDPITLRTDIVNMTVKDLLEKLGR